MPRRNGRPRAALAPSLRSTRAAVGWSMRRGRRLDPPWLGKEALAPPRAPRFSLRPSGGALQRQGEESASAGSACNGHNSRDSCGGRPECVRAQRAEVRRGFPLPRAWGAGRRPSGRGTRQGSRALTDRRRQVRGTRVQTAGGARPCRAPSRSLPQDPREHPRRPSAVLGSGGEAGNHTAPPGVTVSCHKHVSGTCSQTLPGGGAEGAAWVPVSRASTLSEGHRRRAPGWGARVCWPSGPRPPAGAAESGPGGARGALRRGPAVWQLQISLPP